LHNSFHFILRINACHASDWELRHQVLLVGI
jgi:hypothetical protein